MRSEATGHGAISTRAVVELSEWQRRGPKEAPQLRGLSVLDDPAIRAEIEALRKRVDVRQLHDGVEVQATSFVGCVEVGPISLVIRPKLPALPLGRLLRYAYGLRDLSIQDMTHAAIARYGFHDVLIAMLASEVRDLLRQGLSRQYKPVQERLASPRGQLLVSGIARRGGIASATLDCKYYERSSDWLLNRILKTGLIAAGRMTRERALQFEIYELARQFEFVQEKPALLEQDLRLAQWSLTRLTDFNASALAIVRLLWDMMGVDSEGTRDSAQVTGFLFDMNRFFQQLLSRFLHEHLSGSAIADERSIKQLFVYAEGANPRRRSAPEPRPDYALMRGKTLVGFLDAKYRDLWNLDVPQAWIYQLSTYALAAPKRASIMLYPSLDAGAQDERLEVRQAIGSSSGHAAATMTMRPVPLIPLAELLTCTPLDRAACRRLAARLVDFGT